MLAATSQMLGISSGQGWYQLAELGLALVLASAIGLERELRQKSAGLKTYTLVGVASALIVLVSKYGFTDVVVAGRIGLDPSRVAAQIVSGIGFIGGGLIFVRRDAVRGLTTAAAIWLTAGVGMAAGAGLPILAIAVTASYFLVAYGYTPLARRLPRSRFVSSQLRLVYEDQRGVLRRALAECTARGFTVAALSVEKGNANGVAPAEVVQPVAVMLEVQGKASIPELVTRLDELEGVLVVSGGDASESPE